METLSLPPPILEGPGHEQTRMELHLLHGVKSEKIVGISRRGAELFKTDAESVFSVQEFEALWVLPALAVTGAPGTTLSCATGVVVNTTELLGYGSDKTLDTVETVSDVESVFSVQEFTAVCILPELAVTGAPGTKLSGATGVVVNTTELLGAGSDKTLDTLETVSDDKVDCISSVL